MLEVKSEMHAFYALLVLGKVSFQFIFTVRDILHKDCIQGSQERMAQMQVFVENHQNKENNF